MHPDGQGPRMIVRSQPATPARRPTPTATADRRNTAPKKSATQGSGSRSKTHSQTARKAQEAANSAALRRHQPACLKPLMGAY